MGLWSRLGRAFRKDSGAVGSELAELLGEGWGRTASGVPVNSISAMQQATVMACVAILSEDVAKLPLQVWRRTDDGGRRPVPEHFLHRLLRSPNPWQTRFEFVEMMMSALVLRGNGYAPIVRNARGVPQALVPVHPDRVALYEAPDGQVFYLVTRTGLHETAVLQSLPLMIHSEDMLHLKWLSSWNSLLGVSRISLMRESIGLAMGQEMHAARLAGNGARPGGVLQTDAKLAPEVVQRLREEANKHAGPRWSGGTMVLEQGLKWQPLGMTMVDAEFLASRGFQQRQILQGFRMPPHKLGIEGETSGPSMVQQDQVYLNDVLSAYCERIVLRMEKTFEIEDGDLFLEFDYEHFLKADIQTRYTVYRLGIMSGVLKPNEARGAEGLPKDDAAGDKLLQPANMVPLGTQPHEGGGSPGSDASGAPAEGGDGDATRLPALDPAPST
jgi:HK97 family phage portal protein